jgi:hypothetical protein
VLEKNKKDANDFWNGERRANNIRRNEWDLMDFYDQQEKVQCISMAGSLIDNHQQSILSKSQSPTRPE